MLGQEVYKHSYPHCWRSKTPIIFRAVEQFFISLDTLRGQALTEIDKVEWLPAWGRNRIYGTVESRPDWCISRQRTWGVPLPVFFAENGEVIISSELARKVADLVEKEGTNVWFEKSDAELAALLGLPAGVKNAATRSMSGSIPAARTPPCSTRIRSSTARPISIWKPPTSTAAGSRARSCSAPATAATRLTRR